MSTTIVRTRVDSARIRAARKILNDIGLKPADAVNMFFAQVVAHQGIPFAVQRDGYAYAMSEYGLAKEEVDRAHAGIKRGIARERKAGTVREFHGVADLLE
ncbi:MAG: type II toxin-antitoxin system RelB/DinJ family antitoxin [Opitutaceae bacterium]|jgi:addiction module RelB/DinJ family antitoxin|nr:type II toxin-antitoxin system RelB/DinJ family antitoxin [Opitutaceae bacterium]